MTIFFIWMSSWDQNLLFCWYYFFFSLTVIKQSDQSQRSSDKSKLVLATSHLAFSKNLCHLESENQISRDSLAQDLSSDSHCYLTHWSLRDVEVIQLVYFSNSFYKLICKALPVKLFLVDKSTLVQVMAWCCQATSHYLSQCWPRSMWPCGITASHLTAITIKPLM